MMTDDDIRRTMVDVAALFDEARIDWFVVGGAALSFFGAARPTRGVDIVADLPPWRLDGVVATFARGPIRADATAIRESIPHRRPFRARHVATNIALTVIPRKLGYFDDGRFARVREFEGDGARIVRVASPEDVVLKKLESYRFEREAKHLADVRALLTAIGSTLDLEYLEGWLDGLGVREVWDECRCIR
ncbi:MAG: hypothetical protein HYR85_01540 [Planctomycetes bacterium]|nr:hypothetical protein [Planctomycetota bacterium]MBI3843089.1 hypothetical protein [Planctomycetota bacterium]